MSWSSEGQGHNACLWRGLDLSNNVCEYEVNRFTNEKVIRGKQNFNAIANDAECPPNQPDGFTNL